MADAAAETPARLAAVADAVDLLLCDLYGTIHDDDGLFPQALDALFRFRRAGGAVVLVSNAASAGERLAARLALPDEAYDALVTSADVALTLLADRGVRGAAHLGSAGERASLQDDFRLVDVERAEIVLCTGYPAEDFAPTLEVALARGLDLVCTNPDTEIDAGGRRLRFAGLVAERYRALGGRVIETGKPSRRIYAAACALGEAALGRAAPPDRTLGVGDSLRLDVEGARACGFRALWIDRGPSRADPPSGALVERAPTLIW